MIEVFKTDVQEEQHARLLAESIQSAFEQYHATFDLGDCDKILRIHNPRGVVQSTAVINILRKYGYFCDVLEDEVPAFP
jgi:hypothetical protein